MIGKVLENKGPKGAKWIVRFKKTFRRFKGLQDAEAFLSMLRWKNYEETYDPRDYKKDVPLGFDTLSQEWLLRKEGLKSYPKLKLHIRYASDYWQNKNIRDIQEDELDDFFFKLPGHLSGKSKHNIKSTLHTFWVWVVRRNKRKKVPIPMPDFPTISYTLAYRKTVDKSTQIAILAALRGISWVVNPRIYIGCLWLSTYVNVRPGELIQVREDDIDLSTGIMLVRHSKEGEPKRVHLLPEDVETVKSFPRVLGNPYFFRHGNVGSGIKAGTQFGPKYLNKWWMKACEEVGVEGVSLYPGTKHSSIIALGDDYTPEQIKKHGSGHTTNKAFDRYYQVDAQKKRELFAVARGKVEHGREKQKIIRIPQ